MRESGVLGARSFVVRRPGRNLNMHARDSCYATTEAKWPARCYRTSCCVSSLISCRPKKIPHCVRRLPGKWEDLGVVFLFSTDRLGNLSSVRILFFYTEINTIMEEQWLCLFVNLGWKVLLRCFTSVSVLPQHS